MKPHTDPDNPGVIAFPPFIFASCAGVGILLHYVFPIHVMRHSTSVTVGVSLSVVSAGLAIWAARAMKAAGTNIRPDRPSLAIVKTGPYRFTRNPMYLSLTLLQLAIGFGLDDWVPLLLAVPLILIFHFGVILREERYLAAKFGEPYLAYKREVRRWL